MRLNHAILVTALAIVSPGWAGEPPAEVEHIAWETRNVPSCGRCDKTVLTVGYDGRIWIEQGHWAGEHETWRVGRRETKASAEALARFRERLAPLRPTAGDVDWDAAPPCKTIASDESEIVVVWRDTQGVNRLLLSLGCGFEGAEEMRHALRTAPTLLQLRGLRIPELE